MTTMMKNSKKKAPETHLGPNDDKSDSAISDRLGITITAPNFQTVEVTIRGITPMVQLAFGEKARNQIREKQAAGSTAKKGKREAKDFAAAFEQAIHRSREGWCGLPASAIRAAMIRGCSLTDTAMTLAKLCVFVMGDGYSATEGTPLIRLFRVNENGEEIPAEPHHVEHMVKNATGVADIRVRAMYDEDWRARVRIRFDADRFTTTDVANLVMRAGLQVGVGEGRPSSPKSCGMGWGQFECVQEQA